MQLSDAQRQLVADNQRLAYYFAKRFYRPGRPPPIEDLEAEALLSLCKSAAHHKPDRGEFGPFASYNITHHLASFRDRELMRETRQIEAEHYAAFGRLDPSSPVEARELIAILAGHLQPRSFDFLMGRYGYDLKLRELGDLAGGITRERARQIADEAMKVARRVLV